MTGSYFLCALALRAASLWCPGQQVWRGIVLGSAGMRWGGRVFLSLASEMNGGDTIRACSSLPDPRPTLAGFQQKRGEALLGQRLGGTLKLSVYMWHSHLSHLVVTVLGLCAS